MLSEIFYWFLNMSITASITGGVVFIVSKIKILPRRLCYALWAIPLIRLWIPFAPSSEYGLMALISRFVARTVVVHEGTIPVTALNSVMLAESYYPFAYRDALIEKIFYISSIIWILVTICIITVLAIAYISAKRELRNTEHYHGNIWFSDKIQSPAVYGIICPMIVLPMEYKSSDNTFILMHENVHIKRQDNLWRVIAFATAAFHWFNPFIWLFLKSFFNEMELSCDEKVLAKCSKNERKAYAFALIESAEMKARLVSSFAGGKLRKRIEHILNWKRMSALAAVCFIVFAAMIAYVLITNPV